MKQPPTEERLPLRPADALAIGDTFVLLWTWSSKAFSHWPWTLKSIEGGKFHFENQRGALKAVLGQENDEFVDRTGETVEVRRA